jgi:peptidoglycan hydrolase-like protein with peptidoglycan-binding domain
MRTLLQIRKTRMILAALAVGSLVLPAAALANGRRQTAHKPSAALSKTKSGSKSSVTSSKKSTKGKNSGRKGKKVKGQAAPTPERIGEIQSALARHGVYAGESTGKWDDSTSEAMKKFQSTHGLTPTGKYDALTLQRLGLGSDTAGRGAPTPPPNTANRLLSPKVQREEAKNEPMNEPE